jgi:hypothetical protein
MSDQDTVTYECDVCGFVNTWTRDEIVQRGEFVVYRDTTNSTSTEEDYYSLKCRNPRLNCPARMIVAVEHRRA